MRKCPPCLTTSLLAFAACSLKEAAEAPYQAEAKEFLRARLIGKKVMETKARIWQ